MSIKLFTMTSQDMDKEKTPKNMKMRILFCLTIKNSIRDLKLRLQLESLLIK